MSHRSVFLFLVLMTLTASSGHAGCKFRPSEEAQRIIDDKENFRELVDFAESVLPDEQAHASLDNEIEYPPETKFVPFRDKVSLKILSNPNGVILDAKIINKGKHKNSGCLALQWASESNLVAARWHNRSVSSWAIMDVYVTYDEDETLVAVLPPIRAVKGIKVENYISDSTKASTPPSDSNYLKDVLVSQMTYSVAPEYPPSEMKAGHEGDVCVKVMVGTDGTALIATIHESSGYPLLDNAALDVALKNKFAPVTENGRPVALWVAYMVRFRL